MFFTLVQLQLSTSCRLRVRSSEQSLACGTEARSSSGNNEVGSPSTVTDLKVTNRPLGAQVVLSDLQ
jgi:hypothetical protein